MLLNEQGFDSEFKSQFGHLKYCSQGIKFREYLDHELAFAVANKNPDAVDVLNRLLAFAKANELSSILKPVPVKSQSITKSIKTLSVEDKERVASLLKQIAEEQKKKSEKEG